jgi:two-component system, OmpR family, phosphate regulon sensor histidine kinase PhoR
VTNRVFLKLLAALALGIIAATATFDWTIRRTWEDSLRQDIQRNLTEKTLLFANRVNSEQKSGSQDMASQEAHAAGARATIIDATGKVLADSETDPATVGNLAQRPEFAAALHGQVGSDVRTSESLSVPFLYIAAPVSGGAVRLSYPLTDVQLRVSRVRRAVLLASGLTFLIALLVAGTAALSISGRLRRIVRFADRIAAGDLAARIAENSLDEIGQVAAALDKTARQVESNFHALQTSQRELETLLNSMQDAVIAVGPDGRVQWANRSMDRLRHTRLNAPLVETVRDPDVLRAVQEASAGGKVSQARATSIFPARTFDVTAAPLPGGGAVAVLRDLTETERMEKTRRDFIANVSHELRTPLTSIQGYSETLLDVSTDNQLREFLEIIRKNANRMARLTEDLLTLARVESGEHRFDVQLVTPDDLLHEAFESFSEVARSHGVDLQVEHSAIEPVSADREAIHQVFSNLLDNALKYGGSGGKVVLGARRSANAVEFYVRDHGPGIPSEHLPRLFERFYRVDKARSRESGGTGLGLAIAKHIVLAHGGTIRAESELNHGSVFLFTLPLAVRAPMAV